MDQDIRTLEMQFDADRVKLDPQALRVKYIGRGGLINDLFGRMAKYPPQEKSVWGRRLNEVKQKFTQIIEEKALSNVVVREQADLTLPGKGGIKGSLHVLSQVNIEICSVFERMGFQVIEGPDIEDDWHNFTALNFPCDHPSRDSFDTFFLDTLPEDPRMGRHLLRCHTSPNQIRVMEQNKPPLAVISPGRVYRPDEVDATHSFMFHQVEGFAVGENIDFSHLKGVLFGFAREYFNADSRLRFRPHYFPFTETSDGESRHFIFLQTTNYRGKTFSLTGLDLFSSLTNIF